MKDYNIMSEYGTKDQDFVDEFGMPQEFVGTPRVNEYMIDKMYEDNIRAETEANINDGMEPRKATHLAEKKAIAKLKATKRNLQKVTKARGY